MLYYNMTTTSSTVVIITASAITIFFGLITQNARPAREGTDREGTDGALGDETEQGETEKYYFFLEKGQMALLVMRPNNVRPKNIIL